MKHARAQPSIAAPELTYFDCACAEEGDDDGHDVDGQLELEELGDAVVDVAAPHHRFDDAREVVVGQDDVRRLFRYVCARDALSPRSYRVHSRTHICMYLHALHVLVYLT